MLDLVIALLVLGALGVALSFRGAFIERTLPSFLGNPLCRITAVFVITFLGCWLTSALIQSPVPRTVDEFSYLLISETVSHGRIATPTPPLREFFDTFHELVRPVYASKYFPVQGLLLAIGEKLTGHPAIGILLWNLRSRTDVGEGKHS